MSDELLKKGNLACDLWKCREERGEYGELRYFLQKALCTVDKIN